MNLSSSYYVDLAEDETWKTHVLLPVEIFAGDRSIKEFLVPCV